MAMQAHKVKQITLKPREPAGTTKPGKSSYSLYTSREFKSSMPVYDSSSPPYLHTYRGKQR